MTDEEYRASQEFKRDLRVCIIWSVVIAALFFFVGRVSACESYEDCMEKARANSALDEYGTRYASIAVAYKLDEISRKLDA